ncbi:hypothetical protein Tco_0289620 [Tanacetum coccineum]
MVAFLSKPAESDGFEQIVDFLNAHRIRYVLTVNPTIYTSCIEQFWSTVMAKTINGEVQLHALVDGKKIIITECNVRRDLQLANEEGVDCLPNSTIFEQLALMGPKTTAWNEFSSTMTSAIICLATNQKFNFLKYIFESMVRNLDNLSRKFLMYPRKPKRKNTQVPQSSDPSKNVIDEAIHKELGDSLVRAAITASSLEAEQDSGNSNKTRSKATPNESSSLRKLIRGNILQRDEDRLKLDELMALCSTLQTKVLDLERTKTTQDNEIASEDASKQGRINAIDVDEEITLVNVQDDADNEMFDVNVLEITLAQALEALKTSKPKVKGIVFQEPDQISFDEETTLKLQAEFDEEERLARDKTEKEQEANSALIEEWDDIQAKINADHQLVERLQAQEQEKLSVEEKATLFQQLL